LLSKADIFRFFRKFDENSREEHTNPRSPPEKIVSEPHLESNQCHLISISPKSAVSPNVRMNPFSLAIDISGSATSM
jgi:hypothetical protein